MKFFVLTLQVSLFAMGCPREVAYEDRPYVADDDCLNQTPRIVRVETDTWCSGVVIKDGVVLTASHCANQHAISQHGETKPVTAVFDLEQYDVAILIVPGAIKEWTGGIAAGAGHGEDVILEGLGCNCVVRSGTARVVSGEASWPEMGASVRQCPGDSGGAIFNMDGDLVGVNWGGGPGHSIFTQSDFIADEMERLGM